MADEVYRLLLVDDDPAILRLYGAFLAKDNWEVETARDGAEAKAMIERRCPHVLITDWNMPGMTGIELCRWLRSQTTPHYVFATLFTSRSQPNDLVQGLEAGANDFIRKPADRLELLARARAGRRVVELEQNLTQLAKCDPLTGLQNRKSFMESFLVEWSLSQRHVFPISCVMLDIDYFKRINDTFGHATGDQAIRAVAATLKKYSRSGDVVCRYGGEEFAVLMPETDEKSAVIWATRVKKALAAIELEADGEKVRFTASFGVAERTVELLSPDQLIDMADQALLVAKGAGRDRVVSFQAMSQIVAVKDADRGAASVFKNLEARQVMTSLVAGLNQDDTVGSACDFFLRFRINFAPVVDSGGRLIGVLSEKDLMALMIHSDWHLRRVREVMKCNVVFYEENTPALQIYQFLCRVSLPGVMIVSGGCPTGIVSRAGLMRWFANMISAFRVDPVSTEPAAAPSAADTSAVTTPRDVLISTSKILSDEAHRLVQRLERSGEELIPTIVGASTRMQEVINDLLVFSRYTQENPSGEEGSDTQLGIAGLLTAMNGRDLSCYESG
jgi:two-component system cell cycle response regulator